MNIYSWLGSGTSDYKTDIWQKKNIQPSTAVHILAAEIHTAFLWACSWL